MGLGVQCTMHIDTFDFQGLEVNLGSYGAAQTRKPPPHVHLPSYLANFQGRE